MSTPVVRFAPSPTGRIHIGNTRTAFLNYIFAMAHGGRFVLRFDDTDVERSRREHADATEVDLAWLGIRPDLLIRQSERTALYTAATERLKAIGRLYPCFETAEELERRRKRMQARGLPPVYDRAALKLTPEEGAALEAEGRRPHWRFKLEQRDTLWTDLVRGPSHIDCASLSDPVLIRADGSWLYTLTSVVDDVDIGITHVIRGEDHVTNTAVQIQIFEALGAEPPAFGHHNLLTTASGEGLSKRTGALSIGSLRESGVEPLAVAALAVLTGSALPIHPITALEDLRPAADLSLLSRTPARFDEADLHALSAKTLHGLPFAVICDRLPRIGIGGQGDAGDEAKLAPFWSAVRGNLARFDEAAIWWRVIAGEVEPVVEDAAYLATALDLLPAEPWSEATWAGWTAELKKLTGRKGKALFHPLRLALTGAETGPDLGPMLPLIGRLKASARLAGSRA